MKIFFKILITVSMPLIWIFQENHSHICSWRCVGMYHEQPLRFFKTLKMIWAEV
jgi:hypothetical protein